jgi:hypothetical protein
MFAQIVIDCQTKKEVISCGYCIIKEACHLRLELAEKEEVRIESPRFLVPLMLMETCK